MDAEDDGDSISKIFLNEETLFGTSAKFTQLDKMCGIVIRIRRNKNAVESRNTLIAMLEDMLANESKEIKKRKLHEKYDMKMTVDLERRIRDMCNLSDIIEEKGLEEGVEKGKRESRIAIIRKMIQRGDSKSEILELGFTEKEYAEAEGNTRV